MMMTTMLLLVLDCEMSGLPLPESDELRLKVNLRMNGRDVLIGSNDGGIVNGSELPEGACHCGESKHFSKGVQRGNLRSTRAIPTTLFICVAFKSSKID